MNLLEKNDFRDQKLTKFYYPLMLGLYVLLLISQNALRPLHVFFLSFIAFLFLLNQRTRFLLFFLSPYVIHAAFFDSVRYFPEEWMGKIHVRDIYDLEMNLFGINIEGLKVIPSHFLQQYLHPFLDFISGCVYILHEPTLIILCIYLFKKKKFDFLHRLSLCFLIMNVMAILTHIIFPVAPPWFVDIYGFYQPEFHTAFSGSEAGLSRFDNLIGLKIFAHIYGASPVVFGAIPSMHAGFSLMTFLFVRELAPKFSIVAFFYFLTMLFAAVYLRHHYIIDLIAGIAYCLIAYFSIKWLIKSHYCPFFRFFTGGYDFSYLHR